MEQVLRLGAILWKNSNSKRVRSLVERNRKRGKFEECFSETRPDSSWTSREGGSLRHFIEDSIRVFSRRKEGIVSFLGTAGGNRILIVRKRSESVPDELRTAFHRWAPSGEAIRSSAKWFFASTRLPASQPCHAAEGIHFDRDISRWCTDNVFCTASNRFDRFSSTSRTNFLHQPRLTFLCFMNLWNGLCRLKRDSVGVDCRGSFNETLKTGE